MDEMYGTRVGSCGKWLCQCKQFLKPDDRRTRLYFLHDFMILLKT